MHETNSHIPQFGNNTSISQWTHEPLQKDFYKYKINKQFPLIDIYN